MKTKQDIKILAIETSCDETAAAVIGVGQLAIGNKQLAVPVTLSNIVSSQVDLHAKTGGVVPEVASRAHMEAIFPVVAEALLDSTQNSKLQASSLIPSDRMTNGQIDGNCKMESGKYSEAIRVLQNEIDYIAVTAGPGLVGSLLVGFNAAKSLAYALDKPIIPINHIEGHIYSAFGQDDIKDGKFDFPVLSLTVSGGHTSITLMKNHGEYENIGQTLDDAAGEAFDKVAKLLGLGYPGGPAVSKLASEHRNKLQVTNNNLQEATKAENYKLKIVNYQKGLVFPRPILNDGTFNFSFSGLKTAVLQHVLNVRKERELTEGDKQEICAAFEDAAVDVLVKKTIRAAKKYEPKMIILAGGVAANEHLRGSLAKAISDEQLTTIYMPVPKKLSGDNAVMIGLAAYYHIQKDNISSWDKVKVDSNLEL